MMSFMRTIIAKLSTLHTHEKHIKCVNHVLVHVSPMSPAYTGQAKKSNSPTGETLSHGHT